MTTDTDPSKEWNQNILRNLKASDPMVFKEEHWVSDRLILKEYDEYSRSGFAGTFTEWMIP